MVVPVNFATADPPCPSNTPKNALPSSVPESLVTVQPAGWAGIFSALGAGGLDFGDDGGRYR